MPLIEVARFHRIYNDVFNLRRKIGIGYPPGKWIEAFKEIRRYRGGRLDLDGTKAITQIYQDIHLQSVTFTIVIEVWLFSPMDLSFVEF